LDGGTVGAHNYVAEAGAEHPAPASDSVGTRVLSLDDAFASLPRGVTTVQADCVAGVGQVSQGQTVSRKRKAEGSPRLSSLVVGDGNKLARGASAMAGQSTLAFGSAAARSSRAVVEQMDSLSSTGSPVHRSVIGMGNTYVQA